ncbi:MAG: hypothetical protein IJM27_03000 [Eubacterium sp.]|nr:hypothetical protein [Eubacterium sp.]
MMTEMWIRTVKLKKGRKVLAILLSLGLLGSMLTACGEKEAAEKPELMEPAAVTESFRKVSRRDIGDIKFLKGSVVAREYPVFSEGGILIDELRVSPGDHVSEGDVIATGYTKDLDQEIRSLESQAGVLSQKKASDRVISEKEETQLGYKKAASEKVGYTDEAAAYEQQIRILQENRRYQQAEYDSSLAEIDKQLTKLRKEKGKLVFTAPHSGYVTFLKDISSANGDHDSANAVSPNENIAVISDYDDLYIETPEKRLDEYKYGNYDEKYILMNGTRYKVTEEEYTAAERSFASMQKNYPFQRFRAEGVRLELGTTLLIYFSERSCTDVLAIGNDSVYREGDISYCYVRKGTGDRERREITTGERDSFYTEILSGLKEGEEVYYENKSVLPVKYETHVVETKDYVEENQTGLVSRYLTEHEVYSAKQNGTLQNNITSGMEVKKGDDLAVMSVHVSKADLAETKNRISSMETAHTAALNELATREKEARDAIANAPEVKPYPEKTEEKKEEKTGENTEEDTEEASEAKTEDKTEEKDEEESEEEQKEKRDAYRDSLYVKEINQAELDIIAQERVMENAEYNHDIAEARADLQELSRGSGNGEIVVQAEQDGYVGVSHMEAGRAVYSGDYLCTLNWAGKKLLRISMSKTRGREPSAPATAGQEIVFKAEDGKIIKGTCVAVNGGEKNYLFTRNDKQYITYSSMYADGIAEQFFAVFEDDSIFDEEKTGTVTFKGVSIPGGIVVPAKAVYTEVDKVTQESVTFVWKVEENGLVKQPVTAYEGELISEKLILSGIQAGDKIAIE